MQLAGEIYDAAPYGWRSPRARRSGRRCRRRIQSLIDDGTYTQIPTKWGVEAGDIKTAHDQRRAAELTCAMTSRPRRRVQPSPELIKAVPLRRPGRWIAAAIVLILLGLFIYGAATNKAYDWGTFGKYLFDQRIAQAAVVTL